MPTGAASSLPDLDILHPDDVPYLRRALDLAAATVGLTSPNPMVGCVLVKHGEIVGEGAHRYAERDHAEVVALRQAGRKAAGATAYITLEPCGTTGRTGPCTQALIDAHVTKVVMCMKDPNPQNAGVGYEQLLQAGVILRWGLLKEEAMHLNRAFIKVHTRQLPYVTIKIATSADGRLATSTGESAGLSGPEAHWLVHQLRATVDGIVIGARTLTADNPRLTTRWDDYANAAVAWPAGLVPYAAATSRTPVRIVVSGQLAFEPAKYRLFQTARELPVMVVTRKSAPVPVLRTLEMLGVRVLFAKANRAGLEAQAVLQSLMKAGLNHLLIEGGGQLLTPILEQGLWDELLHIQAPVLLGGESAPSWMVGKGSRRLGGAPRLCRTDVVHLGDDLAVRYVPQPT